MASWSLASASKLIPAEWPEPFETRQRAIAGKAQLTPARSLARARRLSIARDRALDLDLDLNRDLALDRDRARDRDLARDLARARDRDLALARDRDFALDRAAMLRARALAFDLARDPDLARALALAGSLALALALRLALARDRDRARDLALGVVRALLIFLLLRIDRNRGASNAEDARVAALIRSRDRGLAFMSVWTLDNMAVGGRRFGWASSLLRSLRVRRSNDLYPFLIDRLEEAIWDLHMAARLAHERISGIAPPFEALRIVRERVDGENSAPSDVHVDLGSGRMRVTGHRPEVHTDSPT